MAASIDWKNLGFAYMDTGNYVCAMFDGGAWHTLEDRSDPLLTLHAAATCLHYGQACFEGLKAFARKDGSVAMFRPEANAKRLADSARRLVMEPVPEDMFIEACKRAITLNSDYIPPYGTGASLYLRPLLIGTTPRVGLRPAEEFMFVVLAMPVGPYYKDGFFPVKAYVQQEYDRAAPRGVGNVKAAGNYAAGLMGDMDGKKKGYPICLYLDSGTRRHVDEFGTSNFFGITKDGTYVTPDSSSVLPSITNDSLQQLACDFGLNVQRRAVEISELDRFAEVGACGTAAVITPISSVTYGEKEYTFGDQGKAGETLTRLYTQIQGIQYGDIEDRHGWMVAV